MGYPSKGYERKQQSSVEQSNHNDFALINNQSNQNGHDNFNQQGLVNVNNVEVEIA